MNDNERHTEVIRRLGNIETRVESVRIELNGRLGVVEKWQAKFEGAMLGGKLFYVLPAYLAAGAALVIALR